MKSVTRVLLVDDHAVVRDGLRALVGAQDDMVVVGEAEDGRTALAQAEALSPDVVVLDVSLPDMNGVDVASQLRARSSARVLALTAHEDRGYLRGMLDAGVTGYALKRASSGELLRALRATAAGERYLDAAVVDKAVSGFVQRPAPTASGVELSEREEQVLREVARGYSCREIASTLSVGVKSVETYKARAIEKLGLRGRVDMVRYALKRGWLSAEHER